MTTIKRVLINPKSPNPHWTRGIEPPIWCALMAGEDDLIWDEDLVSPSIWPLTERDFKESEILIVAMGANPSVASTSKMPRVYELKKMFPQAKVTGLHPMATGEADVDLPCPEELVKIKRAKWECLLVPDCYVAHNWHCLHDVDDCTRYAVLYTSYGCPFGCDFCNIHTIYRNRRVYYRNPVDVAEEIDFLVREYDIRHLKLCDELFTLNRRHVSMVCELIKEYKLNIWAYARLGMVTPEMLREMKEAGINWLAYGIESASELVRGGVSKNYGDIFETIKMTKDAGINVMGNFMFGLPNDTPETMEQTLKLAQDLECEYVNFYRYMPYPGSKLYEGVNKNWGDYNQYGSIKSFRDEAFQRYFSNPEYLQMLESKFGKKARHHIEDMLK